MISVSEGLAVSGRALDSTRISGRVLGRDSDGAPQRGANPPTSEGANTATRPEGALPCAHRPRGRRSPDILPKHVQNCAETGGKNWWVYTWKKASPGTVMRTPYRCASWRCSVCRRHEGAVTFARTKEAFDGIGGLALEHDGLLEDLATEHTLEDLTKVTRGVDHRRVVFGVLTLDRDGYYSGEPWSDERAAYAALSRMSRLLLKRVNRHCKKMGWEPVANRWVATVEAHKSGWPHLQIMMYVPPEWARTLRTRSERQKGGTVPLEGWFGKAAEGSGWGKLGTLERAESADAVYGYLTKTCGQHEESVGKVRGELIKLSQLPTNAPVRFRRLRSGKGFLPRRRKDASVTGTLVRRSWCAVTGVPLVMPIHEIKDATARALSAECCYEEHRLWESEERTQALIEQWRDVVPGIERALGTPDLHSFRPRPPPPFADT
jgi:hypothetical protein